MRATKALLQSALRLTMFSRPNCSLCDDAKVVVRRVMEHRPAEYKEYDVMNAGNERWKDLYEFDTPVVHIDRMGSLPNGETTAQAKKLMHRFTEAQLQAAMDAVAHEAK
ncbi:hypothetical protein LTR56_001980 [Elasticomyces elasticus]|nr:hypothetical protein LTR22_011565 [Elasticomyces elasticus]KAK3658124.1 hypothetical protein LTR56_001980 [Elasticomyces elasticus]KAK5749134.1 hypothetical protein LTS12_020829 [Elasticomyces elasticus]